MASTASGKTCTSATRVSLTWSTSLVHVILSLTGRLFPNLLHSKALNLQIFFAVLDGKVEVAVVGRRRVDATGGWTADSAWADRQTWSRRRRRIEVSYVVHVSVKIHHDLWCWHRQSQWWGTVGSHDSLGCEVAPVHLWWRWLPVLRSCVVSWWVRNWMSVIHRLLLRHRCENGIMPVL